MPGAKDFKRHAGLVDQMAGALGVDLEEQMMRGRLSFAGLEDAVLACTGCHKPGDCEHWLATRDGIAAATPGYCRNADLFRDLTGR
ncbi:DUF6455 family protein [Salipiger sp. PrR003]|uniref:DUF6455 family protein n=1 Tax=Salipiger sp. PrR003 TaxID=2706776 RepID=UPI0013DC77AF|nr:DUF6455 family protein [Salipiger sp. PrR003]NDV54040.1 hypothetical protein [Salipiger sp. PrR003]